MAGRGPAPKHPSVRSRRNASVHREIGVADSTQPELPDCIPWPEVTREWWQMWRESPQSSEFGSTDWDFLLDTALIHADVWSGNLDRLAELRIRVAKFGATPEDRARLKIQYAQAEVADDRAQATRERRARSSSKAKGAADPRVGLHAVG